jgi:hypothetical protein
MDQRTYALIATSLRGDAENVKIYYLATSYLLGQGVGVVLRAFCKHGALICARPNN